MSTNPFRRSSLKGPSGSNPVTVPAGTDTFATDDAYELPLSVNTKVPSTNQKHVNFASPPAVPISPVSYPPSSPESSRISPSFAAATPVLPAPIYYSTTIQSDPFQAETGTDEDDGVIEQALHNAKVNTSVSATAPEKEKEDAVRNTLNRFASAPRRRATAGGPAQPDIPTTTSNRHTMDVDAFKRLLLTGESSGDTSSFGSVVRPPAVSLPVSSDNGSSRDASSVSHQSWSGQNTSLTELSSATSSDDSEAETDPSQHLNNVATGSDDKKPPPPPKSRHGKAIKHGLPAERSSNAEDMLTTHTSNLLSPTEPIGGPRRALAPAPPVARRKSQRGGTSRSNEESPTTSTESIPRAPPVPPTRRPVSVIERRASSDLPPTTEESDDTDTASLSVKASELRPQPPPARNASNSKRISMGPISPPPPPPPRKGRASSRSSIDSQRPSIAALSVTAESARSSGEYSRQDVDARKASAGSNATDILADLAALQREVDEARRRAGQ